MDEELPKRKGLGRMGGEGGIRAGKKKAAITISIYSAWGARGGLCNTEKKSSDSIASYYADGQ